MSSTELLREFAAGTTPPRVTEIVPGTVFHAMGYGHGNATFVIAEDSVILIDTLDSVGRGETLLELIRGYTNKPISTIIYTHSHPDHRGGAAAFMKEEPEIIAFAPVVPPLAHTSRVQEILSKRGERQFGHQLTDDEMITQGLGPREGHTHGDPYGIVPPTRLVTERRVDLSIGGIDLQFVAAQGETDDTIYVWLPQHEVVCCADNYYACWPNLYAVRGGQYRDVAAWIASLCEILALNAEALLPGHFHPILGAAAVRKRLTNYRDAIEFVFNETLRHVNDGATFDEIGHLVQLPEHLRDEPFLREFYGTIEWSAKAIMTGYVGWFDGNPTNLHPLPPRERATRHIAAMGGEDSVVNQIELAIEEHDYQWAMELCDYLLAADMSPEASKRHKIIAMTGAAQTETSACGRNYYTSYAKELGSID